MGIRLSEHKRFDIRQGIDGEELLDNANGLLLLDVEAFELFDSVQSKTFIQGGPCFTVYKEKDSYSIQADYCIGLDHLGNSGRYIYVEPKLNAAYSRYFKACTEADESNIEENTVPTKPDLHQHNNAGHAEVDYLAMLLEIISVQESAKWVDKLVQIDWQASTITIEQQDDKLTPFLVLQFLQLVKAIVRKGLKKSYYKVKENLNNRIKGKILIGQQIKVNVLKNRLTSALCEYQVFGDDSEENRFLKKVLEFCASYVQNNKMLFHSCGNSIREAINYCRPAFKLVGNELDEHRLRKFNGNTFFSEYKNALKIGQHILKRFAYNITHTSAAKAESPPFWIDMPRLFELYVYSRLVKANPEKAGQIHYQFSTYGNALDILISDGEKSLVIDAKYKLHYRFGQIHEDIRQVSGYARLNAVRQKLKITDDSTIGGLIIYPDIENGITNFSLEHITSDKDIIPAYYKMYKIGVKLPLISNAGLM